MTKSLNSLGIDPNGRGQQRQKIRLDGSGFPLWSSKHVIISLLRSRLHYQSLRKQVLASELRPLERFEKPLRLREMFVAGEIAGSLASRYIHGNSKGPVGIIYPLLFSYWANYLILADAASDSQKIDPLDSKTLLVRCLEEILRPIIANETPLRDIAERELRATIRPEWGRRHEGVPDGAGLTKASILLAQRFGQVAAACVKAGNCEESRKARFGLFVERLAALLQGQLASLEQTVLDEAHSWDWYRQMVLDAKFTNILMAPLALFGHNKAQEARRLEVELGLLLVNALYLHRQLLDDLLDMDHDCQEGILGGPAYLLLGFARKDDSPREVGPGQTFNFRDLEHLVSAHIAAAGAEAFDQEKKRADAFKEAWGRNPRQAGMILKGSLTVSSLLALLEDSARIEPIGGKLNDLLRHSPGAAEPISYYQYRCSRSFRKVKQLLANRQA